MPYQHGWLYVLGTDGTAHEIINHARTTAYLSGVTFDNGVSICDVLADGGCSSYAFDPPCGPDMALAAHVTFPAAQTQVNRLTIPDSATFSAPTQLDIRFAIDGVGSGSTTRYIAMHAASLGTNRAFDVWLSDNGRMVLTTSTTGTSGTSATCDVPLSPVDDLVLGRVTWRSSDGRVQFFRKLDVSQQLIVAARDDDNAWEQIGGDETTVAAVLFNSTATLSIGSRNSATQDFFIGNFYAFSLATTIDGVPAVAINPDDITDTAATSFTATSGQTVTVTRAPSGPALTLTTDPFDGWTAHTYINPSSDTAPWYSDLYPESADAYGFWIEDWTGLDDAHIVRPVTSMGVPWGGGQLGSIRSNERVMKLNVILLGRNEPAVEYLFRWLATTLSSVCSSCEVNSMLLRRICPTNGDLWQGVSRLDQVGLVEGVKWETDPTTQSMCSVRRLSFGLTAGDPCFYVDDTDEVTPDTVADIDTCLGASTTAVDRSPCRPICNELASSCRTVFTFEHESLGTAAPVVRLYNDNDEHSLPVRLICYADPSEVGVSLNPCGLPRLGEVYVTALPPYATLVWDVIGRKVSYHDQTTGGFVPGWAFVSANDRPLRRFFVLPCSQAHVVMEPASLCLEETVDGWSDGTREYFDPHFPTATLSVGERLGCV